MIPIVTVTAILTLTPFVFAKLVGSVHVGDVAKVQPAPGIMLFILVSMFLVVGSMGILIKKTIKAPPDKKVAFKLVLFGTIVSYTLILLCNLILPTLARDVRFIPFAPLYTLPFIFFTAYAVMKRHLLNIKTIATELLIFALWIFILLRTLLSDSLRDRIFNGGSLVIAIVVGILLIRSVFREVRQREKLEILSKELAATNDKLKLADRVKTQFLSFASHQVKSPMTVVKDYADLIADGSYGAVPDKVKETAGKIKDSANRLLELVGNLLDLRKLEEGKVEYKFEDMDLNALVHSTFDELKTLGEAKGLAMTLEAPQGVITIKADQEKLRQVIQNLIDNSVKYTEKGFVKIKLQVMDAKIQISVSDSGLGIPQDLIPTLFEQFNRGSDAAKKIQGTGLGLYIAKQFMEAHKGSVKAESPGPGKGSTFMVELPYDHPRS